MNVREFDELVDEILDEQNDRALIILCSSFIDEQLLNILKIFFKKSTEKKDELLEGDTPLSTFSSRIKVIYRLGLIDNSFKGILDTVRKIRNDCAHKIKLNIHKSPIKEHVQTLNKEISKRGTFKLTKERYFQNKVNSNNELKALFITINVILKAINDSILEIKTNDQTIKISKK